MEEEVRVYAPVLENLLIGLNVFKFDDIVPMEKLVLLCIWSHARTDGTGAYPSTPTIARETGIVRSTVSKALKALEAKGYLRRIPRYTAAGPGKKAGTASNEYVLFYPQPGNPDTVDTPCPSDGHPPVREADTPCPSGGHPPVREADTNLSFITSPLTKDNLYIHTGPTFQEFWDRYPKSARIGKSEAQELWDKAVKAKHDPQDIMDGLERYLAYCAATDTFHKHITTFLNLKKKLWTEDWTYEERKLGVNQGHGRGFTQRDRAASQKPQPELPDRQGPEPDEARLAEIRRKAKQLQ